MSVDRFDKPDLGHYLQVRNPRWRHMACQTNVSLWVDNFTQSGFWEVCGVNMPSLCQQMSTTVSLVQIWLAHSASWVEIEWMNKKRGNLWLDNSCIALATLDHQIGQTLLNGCWPLKTTACLKKLCMDRLQMTANTTTQLHPGSLAGCIRAGAGISAKWQMMMMMWSILAKATSTHHGTKMPSVLHGKTACREKVYYRGRRGMGWCGGLWVWSKGVHCLVCQIWEGYC